MLASTSMKLSTLVGAMAVVAVAPAALAKALGEVASLEQPTMAAVLANSARTPSFAPFIDSSPKWLTQPRRATQILRRTFRHRRYTNIAGLAWDAASRRLVAAKPGFGGAGLRNSSVWPPRPIPAQDGATARGNDMS